MSFIKKGSLFFLLTLSHLCAETLLEEKLILSPQFTRCGNFITVSLSKDGAPAALYNVSLKDKSVRRINPLSEAIEFSPTYSPGGEKIAYISDLGGAPALYIKSFPDVGQKALLEGDGDYLAASWAPNGKWIAFIKKKDDTFFLGLISPDGREQKVLARDYFIESMSWSSDASKVYFTHQNSEQDNLKNTIVDVKSLQLNQQKEQNYFKLAWSPTQQSIAWIEIERGTYILKLKKNDQLKPQVLAKAALITGLAWSPDGLNLAYTSQEKPTSSFKLNVKYIR